MPSQIESTDKLRNLIASPREAGSDHEGFAEKLSREAHLLGLGLVAPLNALRDHPLETGVNLLVSGGMGVGLGLLSRNPETGAAAFARTSALVLGLSSMPMLASSGIRAASAMRNTWASPTNWNKNVRTMQDSLGTLEMNAAMMAVGAVGARSVRGAMDLSTKPFPGVPKSGALESVSTRVPFLDTSAETPRISSFSTDNSEPIGRLRQVALGTVVRITGRGTPEDPNAPIETGSGAVVSSDGKILTAFHVIGDKAFEPADTDRTIYSDLHINYSDGHSYPARFIAATPELDLALLQAVPESETAFPHLEVASHSAEGTPVVAMGFPQVQPELFMNQGKISTLHEYDTESTAAALDGMSGGPLTDFKGHIHTIVSGAPLPENVGPTSTYDGPPLRAIQALIQSAPSYIGENFKPIFVPVD